MNIVFLGPQGSGKSTQAELVSQHLKLPLLVIGDFLRSEARKETSVGRRIAQLIKRGELIEDTLLVSLLKKELVKEKYKGGLILDGAPRTLKQAYLFEPVLSVDQVVYLSIPDLVAYERLFKRGRFDDTPELIKRRLEIYHDETDPVLSYYKKAGVLTTIDGIPDVQTIFKEIVSKARLR
ncbi:MAG: nucleoside monophosphate kinase [Candidatus Blackburnbacteria bacterium]|nr:nucleoside monophosphate kinase [Candidatus Blackburnbacteria bacterium]